MSIRNTLAVHGLQIYFTEARPKNTHKGFLNRAKDIFHQNIFSRMKEANRGHDIRPGMKSKIVFEEYIITLNRRYTVFSGA